MPLLKKCNNLIPAIIPLKEQIGCWHCEALTISDAEDIAMFLTRAPAEISIFALF